MVASLSAGRQGLSNGNQVKLELVAMFEIVNDVRKETSTGV